MGWSCKLRILGFARSEQDCNSVASFHRHCPSHMPIQFPVWKSWSTCIVFCKWNIGFRRSAGSYSFSIYYFVTSSHSGFITSYLGIILYLLGHRSFINFLFPVRFPAFKSSHPRWESNLSDAILDDSSIIMTSPSQIFHVYSSRNAHLFGEICLFSLFESIRKLGYTIPPVDHPTDPSLCIQTLLPFG